MVKPSQVIFVYNATTGEYFSLGKGWTSLEEAIEFAEEDGYIDTETQDGVIGVELTNL